MPKKSTATSKPGSSKKAKSKAAAAPKSKSAAPKRKASTAKRKAAKVASGSPPIGDVRSFDDLPEGETLEFIGLIAPGGQGGGSSDGRAKTWSFSTELAAWKVKGGPIVHESALLVYRSVSERKLSTLMKSAKNLDVISFVAQRPDKKQRPKTYYQPKRFELSKLGPRMRDRELDAIKKELLKPVVHQDATFGTLRLNRDRERFEGEAAFRKTKMYVAFDVPSVDELEELIEVAKPLWKRRQEWFSNWRDRVREYYMQGLVANWWVEEHELTPAIFDRLLGWPVAVSFSREEGEFRYYLGGWSEELFSDHGIDAHGSTIDDLKADF
ncbi:MAG TPA: DUF2262 domain-containing protein [Pirellulaceae bacterium]|jgi:hypothetical protein|nr:DUF2262 domain-containing protein [Pirellulaceae bacterium]